MQLFGYFLFVCYFVSKGEAFATAACNRTGENREGRSWRLPNTTYPLKYHLHITTWIDQKVFNFTGNATIELVITENTTELVLHAKDLNIKEIYIQDLTTRKQIENINQRTIDDLLIIEISNSDTNSISAETALFVYNHRLRLELHYDGIISDKKEGFHIMAYVDAENSTIYGAFTQMEPSFARMVLPCYDEPGLKANFIVSITHGSSYKALSNMPAEATLANRINNMTTTIFMATPLMSTYLLAFVVSNYKYVARENNGILQRAFLPPNSKNNGTLALSNGISAIQTFTRYMNLSYSLPKLDYISVSDNASKFGGMENWGLITYKEQDFVNDNETNVLKYFEQILLQNHEIIHQWFGNLVTPAWWDSLWLKEGFAEYYSFKLANMTNPEYLPLERFNIYTCYVDELYVKLISVAGYVEKPDDIEAKYEFAVYYKAPCIIQMFEHAFGELNFRKGVSNYLKSHAFSIANEGNLFEQLQAALLESNPYWNYNVGEIMKPWFHAQTLPQLKIVRDYNNSNIINLEQYSSVKIITELWWIPLNFATATQPNFESTKAVYYMPPVSKVTLNLTELNITLNANDWLLANIRSTGFYRVYYDLENLSKIGKVLQKNHSVINKHNRALILRSISNMWTEELSLVTVLEVLKYLPLEEDNFVWSALYKTLTMFQSALYYTMSYEVFNDFMRYNVRSHYLKYNGNQPDDFKELEYIACEIDLPECLGRSKELYMTHRENIFNNDGTNKLRPYTICYAAKIYNNTEFEIALKFLLTEPADLEIRYWEYLHCTEIKAQYEKLLESSHAVLVREKKPENIFDFWADLLQTANVMKWNLTFEFLQKQIPELQSLPNATFELCLGIKSKAETIRKPFYAKYIELLKLCMKELFKKCAIRHSSEIMPSLSKIGEKFSFEYHPLWQEEVQKVYEWLKQFTRSLIKS